MKVLYDATNADGDVVLITNKRVDAMATALARGGKWSVTTVRDGALDIDAWHRNHPPTTESEQRAPPDAEP